MSFTEWANYKVRKLTWIDIMLVRLSAAVFGLMIARLSPRSLKLKWYWYALMVIVLGIIPFRNFWKA